MFKTALSGEVNGKEISLYCGKRYKIYIKDNDGHTNILEGFYIEYKGNELLLKNIDGRWWISFDAIEDIVEL